MTEKEIRKIAVKATSFILGKLAKLEKRIAYLEHALQTKADDYATNGFTEDDIINEVTLEGTENKCQMSLPIATDHTDPDPTFIKKQLMGVIG